jgi:hypothetical protein
VLAIAKILDMDDSEKNELLLKAGLSPLQPEELDIDAMLSKWPPGRWRKTYFLRKYLGWDERRVADKLGIPFWDVQNDIKEAENEIKRLSGKTEYGQRGTELLLQGYLKNHYDKLGKLLERLSNELRIPDLTRLCLVTLKPRTSIPHRYGGIDPMMYDEGVINLGVEDSDPFLWKCLRQHLTAEFPGFYTDFSEWEMGMSNVVKGCHHISKIVADQLPPTRWVAASPYLSPDSKDYGSGVYYDILTPLLYECAIANFLPKFDRVSGSRDLLLLGIKSPTARRGIARGDKSLLDEVEGCCLDIASGESVRKKVQQILELAEKLESKGELIRQKLRPLLERGTFKGTCDICSTLVG